MPHSRFFCAWDRDWKFPRNVSVCRDVSKSSMVPATPPVPQPKPSRLRIRRTVGALALGLLAAGSLGWTLKSEAFQLWYLERQSTAELEQTVRDQPRAPWPAYVLGTRYAASGRLEPAMDLFETSRNLEPNNYRPHFSMGLGFLRLGAATAAVPELQRAAELAPKDDRVLTYLGVAFRQVDRYRDAVIAGQTAVKLNPRSAENFYQLGLTYYRPTGQQGKGRECFQRAVELDPTNAAYHRDLASSFSDMGEYEIAGQHAREAVRLNPSDAVARYLLGKVLHRSQANVPETVQALREAIRLSPNTFQPHYELGLVLEESGEYAEAHKEFEISSRINAQHQQSWFHQSSTAARLGRTAQATAARQRFQALTKDRDERQFLERRVFDHPTDIALRLRFAKILERNDDLVGAAAQCQAILKQNPKHAETRSFLQYLAKRAGVNESGEPASR